MNFFDEIFPALGVEIRSNAGKLHLRLKGPFVPANIQTDCSISSEFLTAIFMAYAGSLAKKEICIQQKRASDLKGFEFDATDCPDLFPPLVALASVCQGPSFIKGAGRLKHKESDRALTLQEEFAKLGVDILLHDDVMGVRGTD